MNIIIIGGSGFIGTALLDITSGIENVVNIDKAPSAKYNDKTILGDIRDVEEFAKVLGTPRISPDSFVILLAAEHRDDVTPTSSYYDVNVEGTRNVLKAMDEKGITKIIFTSSVAVYGLNKENPSETTPVDPFNDYGKSKWEAEVVLREWYNKDTANRTLIIIRPTVVFGPGNKGNVYNLLKQIATGRFMMIGKGQNKKSMAYVENIVGFITFSIRCQLSGYHVFNYVDKPDLNMNELVSVSERALNKKLPPIRIPFWAGYLGGIGFDVLAKITRRKFPISSVRVKKFCATTQFSNEALVKLGYAPPYTLSDGLSKTITSITKGA